MLVDWSPEFDQWFTHVEARGGRVLEIATALLQALMELQQKPEESATFTGCGKPSAMSCGE